MEHTGGLHLIMDGRFEDRVEIDVGNIIGIINTLVQELNMVYLTKPRATYTPDEQGISVFAQMYNAHVIVYVWPELRLFSLEIFSYNSFDLNVAGKLLWAQMEIQSAIVRAFRRDASSNILDKGTSVTEAVRMVRRWQPMFV